MERWGRLTGMLFQIELLLILVAGSLAAFRLDDRMLLATEAVGAIAWLAMAWAQQRPDGSRFAEWRGTLQFAACWLIFPAFKAIRAVYIHHPADGALLALDRRFWGGASLPEHLLGWEHAWLSEILSAGYFLFYFVVLIPVIVFSIRRRSSEARAFFTGLTLMYLVGFIGYVLVPAGGPYMAFPETFPYPPQGGPITTFLVSVVKNGITGMDVFPSLHAGIGTYVLGFSALGGYRRIAVLLAPVVMALVVATLYLRYHYGIDVLCGLALAAAVLTFVQRYRKECSP
ncbi:phosphatase PAP2 family protein [Dyella sp. RRB7]|uniref:phosphatase PAP2 family protein n=1 Tax=Dyella sp. RRB7 TaxID=2919502 RepID=UPI001FAA1A81|nr:phosphatase PAP2 family protein [Dyella sp. RRB7]